MNSNIKKIGMQDERELFEVTIRKNHAAEDYAEMIKVQESSNGKRRFIIIFEGFTDKQSEDFMKIVAFDNDYRNAFTRKGKVVNYSRMALFTV